MLENTETDVEAVATALGAVIDAHTTVKSVSLAQVAG